VEFVVTAVSVAAAAALAVALAISIAITMALAAVTLQFCHWYPGLVMEFSDMTSE
jgi:hypothetical protein